MKHARRALLALVIPAAGLVGWSSTATAQDADLTAGLRGSNEVGPPGSKGNVGDRNGSGKATVSGDEDPSTLCYTIRVKFIAPATAAHIHEAPVGVNGPVVVTLAPPTDGSSEGCVTGLDEELVADILSDPREYYVNVHNAQFPAGALRGQLRAAG